MCWMIICSCNCNKCFVYHLKFEYTGSMYRGKLELHPQMEEYCVIEFESRKEYEVFNLVSVCMYFKCWIMFLLSYFKNKYSTLETS